MVKLVKMLVSFSEALCFFRAYHTVSGEVIDQIVVPQRFRMRILQVAHDTPCGGHMDCRKTRNRILQNFFWPGIFIDVA